MRFQFDPSGDRVGGIRLIQEIPDFRICHLEGRNGAGKSLALRLLELISGEQPYRTTPGAWRSLQKNLGETTVTISGLDGQTLRVDLKPDGWKMDPEPVGNWIGDAFLDGRPYEIASIGSLLRVVRIAGDETFERTIRRRLDTESASIKRAHGRFESQRLQLEEFLNELSDATAVVEPRQRDQHKLDSVAVRLKESERDLRLRQSEIALLEEALLARERKVALANQLPDIEVQLAELVHASKKTERRLRSAQDRQAALLADLARGSEVEDQIGKVRQTRDTRLKRLQSSASKVQRAAAQLNVAAEIEAVDAETTVAKSSRDRIQSELASAGHNASVREFTSQVALNLDARRELDPEVVAVLDIGGEGLRITARELRAGIRRRQVELTEIDDDPLRQELSERDQELALRVQKLEELRKLIQKRERSSKLLRESEENLAALVGRAEATSELGTEYEKLAAEIDAIQAELRQQLAQEARLRVQADQLSAGKSAEELTEQLLIALQRLNLEDESVLDQRFHAAKASAEEHRVRLRQLRTEQIELQRSLVLRTAELAQASMRLAALSWLPKSVRQALTRAAELQSDHGLLTLREAVVSIRDSLYTVRDRFDQLVEAAGHLASEVDQRERMSSDVALLSELREEMGDQLRKEFDEEEIRSALFDGGQLEAIDLRKLEAQWITKEGERRSRPFEAFSSGEQVFAYTRARIQRVASIEARHKVIALDEFGAFLARDRLERLARYLRDAVVSSIADQVIIVVPLAANYQAQAKVTQGELGDRFARRAKEIESRSYFAEDATQREFV